MSAPVKGTLLIGFGNPGRRDDGLGPALAGAVDELGLSGLTVDADYQLGVEDAAAVAAHNRVLLVDAAAAGPEPFWVRRIGPAASSVSFSTHSVEPQALLTLARDLFGAEPDCYLMGIRGYEFDEFGEGLSAPARANLAEALSWVQEAARRQEFEEVRHEGWDPAEAGIEPRNEDVPCKTENT